MPTLKWKMAMWDYSGPEEYSFAPHYSEGLTGEVVGGCSSHFISCPPVPLGNYWVTSHSQQIKNFRANTVMDTPFPIMFKVSFTYSIYKWNVEILTKNKLLAELGFLSSPHSHFCVYQIWIASTHTVPSVSDSLQTMNIILKPLSIRNAWAVLIYGLVLFRLWLHIFAK